MSDPVIQSAEDAAVAGEGAARLTVSDPSATVPVDSKAGAESISADPAGDRLPEPALEETPFVHLRVHSAFSLLEGAIKLPDLIKLCAADNMPAVAVTDTANLFGALEFASLAKKGGVQPIAGMLLRIVTERPATPGQQVQREFDLLPLLAATPEGYENLVWLTSESYRRQEEYGEAAVDAETLFSRAAGLICLTGGPQGRLNRLLTEDQLQAARAHLSALQTAFADRLYVELQRHGWSREKKAEPHLLNLAEELNLPLVATNDPHFAEAFNHEAHDALMCIAAGKTVSQTDRPRLTKEHWFKPQREMRRLFADLPEALENTAHIAMRCHAFPVERKPILPAFPVPEGESEQDTLARLAREGTQSRIRDYGRHGTDEEYSERLDFELATIAKMGYAGYFLIVADFIGWAKANDIPVGPGRGSGAGSLIAYALRITDLDPLEHGLLFERFLNPDRISMPDFDVDFCQDRRDEVITYVQNKYGKDRVAQIITYGKLQARAVIRDVGRVLGMPYGQVDRITKLIPAMGATLQDAITQEEQLRDMRRDDPDVARLIAIALQLEGLYRHASTHAAGVVIGDRPLDQLVPVYHDPRSEMAITQFDMRWVEEAGLVKFDFLGLKTLTVLDQAVKLIDGSCGGAPDMERLPMEDRETYELLGRAETIGVFQLESSGMRDMLAKLKPDVLGDITAAVSLYRPGPMEMIPTFIRRKTGEEETHYQHPGLADILNETYGVFVYQEQVMLAARALGGYTPGEADSLRKVMGKKIVEKMPAEREKFVLGGKALQIGEDLSGSIFDGMASFAEYGFNKSHAAAYAVVAFQTAYLKAHFPVQFIAANMNLDRGNTDKLGVYKGECERLGIRLLPPDINRSDALFTVEPDEDSHTGWAIRYALSALKNVGGGAVRQIVSERNANGLFKSLSDFAERTDPRSANKRLVENLAHAGAFDNIHPNRQQIFLSADRVMRHAQQAVEARESAQVSLFGEPGKLDLPPLMPVDCDAYDPLDQLRREFETVGFYLSAHPITAYGEAIAKAGGVNIVDAAAASADRRPKIAGILAGKSVRRSKQGNLFAFVTVSDPTGSAEVAIFGDLFGDVRDMLETGAALFLTIEPRGDGEEKRWIATEIQPLTDALNHVVSTVEVYMDRIGHVDGLFELLNEAEKGRNYVKFIIDLGDGSEAELKLAQRFALPPKLMQGIKSLGVDLVQT